VTKGAERQARIILVGEDEPEMRSFLETALRGEGYRVELAEDGHQVSDCLRANHSVSAVLLSLRMKGEDGLETLRQIRSRNKALPVIMISGETAPRNVVESMRCGATDFLGKPLEHQELLTAIQNALDARPAPLEKSPQVGQDDAFGRWSLPMRKLHAMAAKVGASETPVLIQGETGTGKEVLARHLHSLSRRSRKPFFKLNCAALPSELVESELFGYERGAFTGACQRKTGIFEWADGSTLLLDEIGDMDFKLQAKLLQVLQDNEFQRLGGTETVRVDVRVLAATHNDLEGAMAAGKFREDLYYRLNVVTLYVPPLRERKEDIMQLTDILLGKHTAGGAPPPEITPALQQAMLLHDWPGNVRELENAVRKLLVLRDADVIARELNAKAARKVRAITPVLCLPAAEDTSPVSASILDQVIRAKSQAEAEAISATLTLTNWNRKQAAVLLKIDYKALLYKMKKFGMAEQDSEPLREKVMAAGSGRHF
jgi:two-component system, NtrC family, response regulator AtoC